MNKKVVILIFCLCFFSFDSLACTSMRSYPGPTLETKFKSSSLVFTGVVTEVDGYYGTVVNTTHVYKSPWKEFNEGSKITLNSDGPREIPFFKELHRWLLADESPSCGPFLEVSREYLIFAVRTEKNETAFFAETAFRPEETIAWKLKDLEEHVKNAADMRDPRFTFSGEIEKVSKVDEYSNKFSDVQFRILKVYKNDLPALDIKKSDILSMRIKVCSDEHKVGQQYLVGARNTYILGIHDISLIPYSIKGSGELVLEATCPDISNMNEAALLEQTSLSEKSK